MPLSLHSIYFLVSTLSVSNTSCCLFLPPEQIPDLHWALSAYIFSALKAEKAKRNIGRQKNKNEGGQKTKVIRINIRRQDEHGKRHVSELESTLEKKKVYRVAKQMAKFRQDVVE